MNVFLRSSFVIAYLTAINLASSSHVRADVVTDWNNAALDAIRVDNTAPPIASRSLAILHVSVYDAVNGITRTHEAYLVPNQNSTGCHSSSPHPSLITSQATARSAPRPQPCFHCFTAQKICPSQPAQIFFPECTAAFQRASMQRKKRP